MTKNKGGKPLKASELAKQEGFHSLKEVSSVTGYSKSMLIRMAREHPIRFRVNLIGCKVIMERAKNPPSKSFVVDGGMIRY